MMMFDRNIIMIQIFVWRGLQTYGEATYGHPALDHDDVR